MQMQAVHLSQSHPVPSEGRWGNSLILINTSIVFEQLHDVTDFLFLFVQETIDSIRVVRSGHSVMLTLISCHAKEHFNI